MFQVTSVQSDLETRHCFKSEIRDSRKHCCRFFFLGLGLMKHSGPHRELREKHHKFKPTAEDHFTKEREGEREDGDSHRSIWIHELGKLPLSVKRQELGQSEGKLHY